MPVRSVVPLYAVSARPFLAITDHPGAANWTTPSSEKEESTAQVPLPNVVVQLLAVQRRAVAKRRLAAPTWADLDLVFPTSVGTHMEPAYLLKRWKGLWANAGIERTVRIHQLRHTTATWMHQQGVDLTTIKTILRRTREATTANVYTHVQDPTRQAAAAKMNDLMETLTNSGAQHSTGTGPDS